MDWYSWNVDRYRRRTRHLTTVEHGAYRLLIDEYMMTREPLPDNDLALAAIAKMQLADWLAIAPTIRLFFHRRRHMLLHATCDEILDAQDKSAKMRSDKARKAAEKRHGKTKTSLLRAEPEVNATEPADARVLIESKKEEEDSPPIPPNQVLALVTKDERGLDIPPFLVRAADQLPLIPPKEVNDGKRDKRRSGIAPDWKPNHEDIAFATSRGIDPAGEVLRFVNHHLAQATLSAAWSANWRTWVLNSVRFAARDGASGERRGSGRAGPASIVSAFADAARRRDGDPQHRPHGMPQGAPDDTAGDQGAADGDPGGDGPLIDGKPGGKGSLAMPQPDGLAAQGGDGYGDDGGGLDRRNGPLFA